MSITKRLREQTKVQTKDRKFNRNAQKDQTANWGMVDPIVIQTTIEVVTRGGGALRFGYTADGGAYALGVYGDGEKPYTEYIRPSEDVEAVLKELQIAFEDDAPSTIESERTAGRKSAPTAAQKLSKALEEDRKADG